MAIDPICGMTVEESKAAATSVYHVRLIIFATSGARRSLRLILT